MLVYEQLPDSNPLKKSAAEYINRYEAKYGTGSRSTFGGHAWDAYLLLQAAIPEAMKKANPGTKEKPWKTLAQAAKAESEKNGPLTLATDGVKSVYMKATDFSPIK